MKTAYRNIVFLDECEPKAKHEFRKQVVLSKRKQERTSTTSRHCFLDEHKLKTKCEYRKQVVLSSISEKELHIFFLFNEKNKIIIKKI